jgi:hypothetical protein
MKAVSESHKSKGDFYISHVAPVNHRREVRFRAADAVLLIVLILELAVLTRLFLAN